MKSRRSLNRKIDKTFGYIGHSFLAIYAIYLLCVWISERPSLFINSITVVGAHATSEEGIKAVASSVLNDKILYRIKQNNQLLYPSQEVGKQIRSLSPRIANVKVRFDNHKDLKVIITEYTPNFLYCLGSNSTQHESSTPQKDHQPKDCFFADEEGYVYANAPEYIGYPFVAIVASSSEQAVTQASPVGTHVLTNDSYNRIRLYIDNLSRVGLTTHSVTLLGGGDIRVEVGMPWVLLLATDKDPDRAIANLGVVLLNLENSRESAKNVSEIDLRFGNKIFYR